MSRLNSARSGCRDVFHAFLVKNATYDSPLEIPCLQPEKQKPNKVISFTKALHSTDYDAWVHFYEDDTAFERLYEDRLNQVITERNFELLNQKYQDKQNKLLKEIAKLESSKEEETLNKNDCDKFIENLASYAEIKELNRYILNQLIDVIYVYDPVEEDGETTQKVEIHYKFIGSLE